MLYEYNNCRDRGVAHDVRLRGKVIIRGKQSTPILYLKRLCYSHSCRNPMVRPSTINSQLHADIYYALAGTL